MPVVFNQGRPEVSADVALSSLHLSIFVIKAFEYTAALVHVLAFCMPFTDIMYGWTAAAWP